MTKTIEQYIPPIAITRVIATYHFEGGGFVGIVGYGDEPIENVLRTVEDLIAIKRQELARRAAKAENVESPSP